MADRIFDILATLVVIAGITALILPGRQTVGVSNSFWTGFVNSIKAAQGR